MVDSDQDEPPSKRSKIDNEFQGKDVWDDNDDDDNIYGNDDDNDNGTMNRNDQLVKATTNTTIRTSSLQSSTMTLTGHKGSVYSLKYSPNGEILCSTSFDMKCLLWDHTKGYHNFNVLDGHKNAVLDCSYCDNDTIVTVSADKTIQLWDVNTGQRLKKWSSKQHQHRASCHTDIINSCSTIPLSIGDNNYSINSPVFNIIASGSDDGTCRLWDRRQKYSIAIFETEYPILTVAMTMNQGNTPQVFTAGIDTNITCWDMKQHRKVYAMKGHTDTITSLAVEPMDQTHLLSNSVDQTMKIWDIQPLVTSTTSKQSTTSNKNTTTISSNHNKNRHVKTFYGHKHNAERGILKCCWSHHANSMNRMVSCGSADRLLHIWDEYSTEELYLLPGHKGCINTACFHPIETNIIASGGSDNIIYVGELT